VESRPIRNGSAQLQTLRYLLVKTKNRPLADPSPDGRLWDPRDGDHTERPLLGARSEVSWFSMRTAGAHRDMWMRVWIVASAMFLTVELWSQSLPINSDTREVLQGSPRIVGACCGVILSASSLAWFRRNWRLALCGLTLGALAAGLACLGTVAS